MSILYGRVSMMSCITCFYLQSSTIREFDDRFTAPMFGYATWQDYYRDACLHLCVNMPMLFTVVKSYSNRFFLTFA